MERFLICPKCALEDKERYFSDVGPEFVILSDMSYCRPMYLEQDFCSKRHQIKDTHSSMVEQRPKQTLSSFLKNSLEKIEKKSFREMYPRLLEGDQIWIYRAPDANVIARVMPYAHVVVFLGQNEGGEGEVVHVTNNANFCTPCRAGCCRTGTIKKAAIDDVIEENDQGELKV